ncbi:MAG TPA: protease complex subunit PrcB family protein [Campylobacterales bacterium]|nr:protease complex subunit PrcB family protein [Campylobacterales bacterium]HIP60386.1 protease complex subunit PrcB family protein [Campylobacterales bacterium]
MKTKSILFTLLGLALFSGCTSATTAQKEVREIESPTYNIIKTSQYPADTRGEKEFLVYHSDTQQDIENFIIEYEKLTDEGAPTFEGNMIIAKSGEKRTGGYKISVSNVLEAGRYTEVTILLESPGKECMATMALTNPYVIVELPNDHKDVKFIEKNITVDCN